jgi:hypothetical protein
MDRRVQSIEAHLSERDVVWIRGSARSCVPLEGVEVGVCEHHLVLARVEILEELDLVEYVRYELSQEEARSDSDLSSKLPGDRSSEVFDQGVGDDCADACGSFPIACRV